MEFSTKDYIPPATIPSSLTRRSNTPDFYSRDQINSYLTSNYVYEKAWNSVYIN